MHIHVNDLLCITNSCFNHINPADFTNKKYFKTKFKSGSESYSNSFLGFFLEHWVSGEIQYINYVLRTMSLYVSANHR